MWTCDARAARGGAGPRDASAFHLRRPPVAALASAAVQSPSDDLTPAERGRLAPHVTDLDGPVFALVNLPETVKGALFARYSRYPGTLRRLFLDEFADSVPAGGAWDGREGERAARLFERVFVGYGDDSVAQLGGAHVACEWVSNVLTKVLQRPRLAAYLEQSTRYIAYDAPMPGGGYRYYRDPELGPTYAEAMDGLFETYAAALPRVRAWVDGTFPQADGESPVARTRAVNAKALDLLRGLLPAASLSHMGIYASGQAYEQLILHLIRHPLPEARRYGELILRAVQAVMPSFVARVERPDRGGAWAQYLAERRAAGERWAARLGLDDGDPDDARPSVRLLHVDGDEDALLAALLFESAAVAEERTLAAVAGLGSHERAAMLGDLIGERANRRHRPGRGFEALRYRFEVVSDYGAFRDLQRHRMLTVQWQGLTPELGAGVPEEVVTAGEGDAYRAALEASAAEYHRLVDEGHAAAAPYALCLGYRIRYVLDLNAREAMHLVELRSGREGHPGYRAVAQQMHALIAERHPAVAAAMTHVDRSSEPRLERILAEMREESKRAALAG
jgi:thymidylate synthase ThyX